jgi:hypothetical protein
MTAFGQLLSTSVLSRSRTVEQMYHSGRFGPFLTTFWTFILVVTIPITPFYIYDICNKAFKSAVFRTV